MSNIDNMHADELEQAEEADYAGETHDGFAARAATIAARRQWIRDMAPCESCRAPRIQCERARAERRDPTAPPWFGCCTRGILLDQPCRHVENPKAMRVLLDEIEADGRIRTVAEIDPPPVLGPARVTMAWLLGQSTWWYPHRRPATRIEGMAKTHLINTVKFLERRAADIEMRDALGLVFFLGDPPDEVVDGFEDRDPVGWLRQQPLLWAMYRHLPRRDSKRWRDLEARAVHWHTCPMRRKHPSALDRCVCVRQGGRIVGATNDPATAAAA